MFEFAVNPFSNEGVLFIINNLFRIYVVYRFMRVFFNQPRVRRPAEVGAYLAYFICHSILYMAFDILPLTMVTNVIFMISLSFLYRSRLSTKCVVVLLIYATGLCVEVLVYAIFLTYGFHVEELMNPVLLIGSLVILMIVLLLERLQANRSDQEIRSRNWVVLLLIPVASVLISLVLGVPLTDFRWTAAALLCLLLINFISFYLYDALGKYYVEQSEKQLLVQQNAAFARQFELIQQSQENLRMLRHDMKNHVMTINALLSKGNRTELQEYLKKINANIESEILHVETGNPLVDSILNYKIEEAIRSGARVRIDAHIPERLNIDPFDLNVILGNLMDNAIEGIREARDKEIRMEIVLDRSMLFIKLQNPFSGVLRKHQGELLTTKGSNRIRGIGLRSVQSALARYDGTLDVEADGGLFTATALLYNIKNTDPLLDA
jgi:sensor histidine kinase YesM